MSSKNGKKTKKPLQTTMGKAPPTSSLEKPVDLGVVGKPINTSLFGIKEVLKMFETGSCEVQNYARYECDILYECRVCRNIFRSFANFVLHKRNYCKDSFNPQDYNKPNKESNFEIICSDLLEASTESDSLLAYDKLPSEPRQKTMSSVLKLLADRQKSKEITETALSEDISKESTDVETEASEMTSIAIEKIPTTSAGVFQTVFDKLTKQQEFMRSEVMELHGLLDSDEAVIDSNGQINRFQTEKVNEKIEIPKNTLECTVCNQKFSTRKTLTYHIKYKHNGSRIVYTCPECKEFFANAWCVFRHLLKVHRKSTAQVKRLRNVVHGSAKTVSAEAARKVKYDRTLMGLSESNIITENQQWIEDLEGANDLQMCGGCGKRFERKAALQSHSTMCTKRIAVCNTLKENAKKVDEKERNDKKQQSKQEQSPLPINTQVLTGSQKRKPKVSRKVDKEHLMRKDSVDAIELLDEEMNGKDGSEQEFVEVVEDDFDDYEKEFVGFPSEESVFVDYMSPDRIFSNSECDKYPRLSKDMTMVSINEIIGIAGPSTGTQDKEDPLRHDENSNESHPDSTKSSEISGVVSITDSEDVVEDQYSTEKAPEESISENNLLENVKVINLPDQSDGAIEENLIYSTDGNVAKASEDGNNPFRVVYAIQKPVETSPLVSDKNKNDKTLAEGSKSSSDKVEIVSLKIDCEESLPETVTTVSNKLEILEPLKITCSENFEIDLEKNQTPQPLEEDPLMLLESPTQKSEDNFITGDTPVAASAIVELFSDAANSDEEGIEKLDIKNIDISYSDDIVVKIEDSNSKTSEDSSKPCKTKDLETNSEPTIKNALTNRTTCYKRKIEDAVVASDIKNLNVNDKTKADLASKEVTLEMKAAKYMDLLNCTCIPCGLQVFHRELLLKHMSTHFKWFCFQCSKCLFMSYDRQTCLTHAIKQHSKLRIENIVLPIPNWKTISISSDFIALRNNSFTLEDTDIEPRCEVEPNTTSTIPSTSVIPDIETSPLKQDPVQKMIMEVIFGSKEKSVIEKKDSQKSPLKSLKVYPSRPVRTRVKSVKTKQSDFEYDMAQILRPKSTKNVSPPENLNKPDAQARPRKDTESRRLKLGNNFVDNEAPLRVYVKKRKLNDVNHCDRKSKSSQKSTLLVKTVKDINLSVGPVVQNESNSNEVV